MEDKAFFEQIWSEIERENITVERPLQLPLVIITKHQSPAAFKQHISPSVHKWWNPQELFKKIATHHGSSSFLETHQW
jgi:hypothetical protein